MKILVLVMSLLIAPVVFAADDANQATTEKVEADNSGINTRDDKKSEKTAEDQSNKKADVEITRKIRAELQDKDISTYAKNVKIIVAGKSITLKGPVRTQEEIDMIKKVASTTAPKYKIKNELQVAKE